MKQEYSIKEIEQEMPLTEAWLRRMEKDGHLKLKSPKVRGQVKRLFGQGDVFNVLRLASFRILGFGPKQLNWYKETVKRFRKQAYPFLKKLFKEPDDQFYLFHVKDVFPDGETNNIEWHNFNSEPNAPILDSLMALYVEAFDMSIKAKSTRHALENTEKQLNEFMDDIEKGLKRTLPGFALINMLKEHRKNR
jgi:hypothetical protein